MMRHPVQANGVTRWVDAQPRRHDPVPELKERSMPILRHEIGDVLRDVRQRQGRTLREVSHDARVSLGYLSEVERGQKEASSELLASICEALEIPLSYLLREVSDRLADQEGVAVPDTVPAGLAEDASELDALVR
ncbi:helix-turn-helix transcriptional regulator [Micrococcus sp.]|uniref:helix-turn-helix domain-containing protein n=1 Tax=Micrococcus sp. TaxID=1271 RepID=UPI002A918A07|nr:helix-turn-helix transcriptional regulator [Micrococcus sp.]MDY6055118.1 helix-turn-helix transcriptional regulator [Micrococcus sp.]